MNVRCRKGILLFEVTFVVLLVSIISLFLLRGYNLFLKTGKKSLRYLKLSSLLEEKMWDLQIKEQKGEPFALETQGKFSSSFSWYLEIKDTDYGDLKKCLLRVSYQSNQKETIDTVTYLIVESSD